MAKYKNKEWNLGVTRNMSLWHQSASAFGYQKGTRLFGVDASLNTISVVFDSTKTHVFYEKESLRENSEKVLNLVSTYKGIGNLKKKYKEFSKNLLDSLKECNRKLSYLTLKKFIKNYTIFSGGLNITVMIGRFVAAKLREEIENMGFQNPDDVLSKVTYPSQRTPLYLSEYEMLQIAKIIREELIKDPTPYLKKWLKNHQHIPVNYCEDPWTMEDALKQLDLAFKKDAKNAIKSLEENHKLKDAEKRKILKSFKKELKILAEAVAEGTYLNEFRKQVFCKVSLGYRKIFKKIAEKLGSENWRDCFYLTSDEMLEVMKGKTFDLPKIKQERKIVGIEYGEDGRTVFIKEEYLNLFISEIPNENKETNNETVTEFKGIPANKGVIRGRVKIILDRKDFYKFNEGDILVAPMTSVDYVPIMGIARAFVTNEGGITSHASIVSREMNKPCIIGTKIATKVLKDGDLVEVDADKGLVKIII